jgi:hypothetical protein
VTSVLAAGLLALAGASGAMADEGQREDVSRDESSALRQDAGRNEVAGLRVIGLTDDGHLVRFLANSPRSSRDLGEIEIVGGDGDDTELVGIDYRVQDGRLYGVGNGGGVFVIDTSTAVANFVNELTVALDGMSFGVDFNPAADRLRIISDTGQNLAHNVNAGGTTTMNGTLTYTVPPAAAVAAPGVTGAAYTNNDLSSSTGTTLYDLDTTLDQIVIQSPPGNGILVATGKLGVDAAAWSGLDIYSRLRGGVAVSNHALAVLIVNGGAALYSVELTTGSTARLGTLDERVTDIAIPLSKRP